MLLPNSDHILRLNYSIQCEDKMIFACVDPDIDYFEYTNYHGIVPSILHRSINFVLILEFPDALTSL